MAWTLRYLLHLFLMYFREVALDNFPADTDVLKRSQRLTTKPDVGRTSEKRRLIYDVLKTSYLRCLKDVQFTTSWTRFIYVVLKTSNLRRLEDVDLRCLEDVWFKTSWGSLIYDVLKTSDLRHLGSVWFATSWRRLIYIVLKEVQFKTSSRHLQNDVCIATS